MAAEWNRQPADRQGEAPAARPSGALLLRDERAGARILRGSRLRTDRVQRRRTQRGKVARRALSMGRTRGLSERGSTEERASSASLPAPWVPNRPNVQWAAGESKRRSFLF